MILAIALSAALTSAGGPRTSPGTECREYDRVEYSSPRSDWPGSIAIENVAGPATAPLRLGGPLQRSPQGTASYSVQEPDTTSPGPWTTTLEVFGNQARPMRLRIGLAEHISGGVRVQWLNEKLLWLQMWRGHIVSTDMILDVDTRKFVYQQDANYDSLILPCAAKSASPR